MLGGTMVGARLRDLRAVLTYLRGRHDIDATELFLWGDSFASVNDTLTDFKVPHRVDGRPHQPEPLGGMLALLGALFEDDVKAVYVHGGLIGFQSILESPLVYVPHDVVIPGVLTTGDLCDLAAATAPRPLRLTGIVDGLNRLVPLDDVRRQYEPTSQSYRRAGVVEQFSIGNESAPAEWLLDHRPEKREYDR
jgi:hypothetical protein